MAESASARDRVSSLDRLATTAAGRLGSMTLDERRDVLALLDVRVQLTEEGFHVTGTVCELDLPAEPGPTETKVLHSHGPPSGPGNNPRLAVQVAVPVDGRADVLDVRCAVLAETGHRVSFGIGRHDGNQGPTAGACGDRLIFAGYGRAGVASFSSGSRPCCTANIAAAARLEASILA